MNVIYRSSALIVFLLLAASVASAQTQFQKTVGTAAHDRNYHMTMLQDGSPVATGYTQDIAGNQNDAFLVKYNRFGEVDWAKTYGDAGDETSWDVITTDNNQLVGAGVSSSLGTPNNAATISRLDANGDVIWSTGVYGPNGNVEFYRVMQTSTGEFVATGLAGTTGNSDDIVLCKFSSTGTLLWSRTIGSTQADEAMGITETEQGHYLLAGLTDDNTGNGSSDFAVVKTNTSGQVIWKKLYGGSSGERLNDVVEVNNSYYLTGWSSSAGQGSDDVILMNIDTAGNLNWVKSYGTPEADRAFSMLYDDSANAIMIGGYTDYSDPLTNNRNTLLISVDTGGNLNWAKSYGGIGQDGHWPTGLAQNDDAGYYVLGSTNTFGLGNMDLFLIKTDAQGNTACNQKDPMLTEGDVTGWSGTDFGAAANPGHTSASLAFAGSAWSPTVNALCCQLYAEAGNSGFQCPGDTTVLGTAPLTGYSYTWMEGGTQVGTGSYLEITYGAAGSYTINASASGSECMVATDIAVVVDEPKPDLGLQGEYEFCEGDSVTVTTSASIDSLVWFSAGLGVNVHTGNSFTIHQSDTMILHTHNNDCVFKDTIVFEEIPLPEFELGPDTTFCQGGSVTLEATGIFDFQWLHDTTITDTSLQVDTPGTFILQQTNQFCHYTDTTEVNILPLPEFSLGNDTAMCEGDSITLQAPPQFAYTWLHDPAHTNSSATISAPGIYAAQATDSNQCHFTDSIEISVNPLPAFSLGTDTAICDNDLLTLQVPPHHAHVWLHDSAHAGPTFTVHVAGTYSAQVTDSNNCHFTDSIEISTHPVPEFSLGNDTAFCEGGFTVIQAPMMHDHVWLHDTSIVSKSIVVDTTGLYVAQAIDVNNCHFTDSIKITVQPLPDFSLGPDTSFCDGDSLTLQVPGNFDHVWLHDSTTAENSITVGATGVFAASVTDQNDCSVTDSISVTVHPLPVFSLGNDTAFCEGGSTMLEAPAQFDHIWLHDTTNNAKEITVTSSGTYILQTVNQGCSYYDTIEVQVDTLPFISLGPDPSICPDSLAVITPSGNFHAFEWVGSSTTEDTLYVNEDSTIIVMAESAEGCPAFDTVTVDVISMPDSIFANDTVTFSGSATLDAGVGWSSYTWGNDSTAQTITVSASGWYSVTVTNAQGCALTDSIYANNVSGIQDVEPEFAIYPNPVNERLIIEMENVQEPKVHARIFNATGQMVGEVTFSGHARKQSIATGKLAQGMYLLELTAGDKNRTVFRFVKE